MITLPRHRARLRLSYDGRRFALTRSNVDWLLNELASSPHASGQTAAALAATRITAATTRRQSELTITPADARALLTALDRGERRGELVRGLHDLHLVLQRAGPA